MRISSNQTHLNGLNSILQKQVDLVRIQSQIASGQRITKASDDPIAAITIFNLQQQLGLSNRWIANAENAQTFVQQEEVALFGIENVLQRSRELLVNAGNGSFSDSDRQSLAVELEQRLDELVSLSNTRVNGSEYLFSGFKSGVKPVTTDVTGAFLYNGDQGVRSVEVGSGVKVATADSGYDLFFDIKNGNGDFVTTSAAANTGTGVISPGSVTDQAAFIPANYQIDFTVTGTGQIQYEVFDATPTSILGPVDFIEGNAIAFNSHSFEITGTPAAGDSFAITPSSRQDVFSSLKNAIAALKTSAAAPAAQAQFSNAVSLSLENIDRALENVLQVHSRVGSRLNVIENQLDVNLDFNLATSEALSNVRDLDLASAITELTQVQIGLEAAQASFVRIQGLSLFNFLR